MKKSEGTLRLLRGFGFATALLLALYASAVTVLRNASFGVTMAVGIGTFVVGMGLVIYACIWAEREPCSVYMRDRTKTWLCCVCRTRYYNTESGRGRGPPKAMSFALVPVCFECGHARCNDNEARGDMWAEIQKLDDANRTLFAENQKMRDRLREPEAL